MSLPPGVDPSTIPAGIPPPGLRSNLIDPPSLETSFLAVTCVMIPLVTVVVAIRLYANLRLARKLGWDDGCCVVAMLFSFTYNGLILSMRKSAHHLWDIPVSVFDEDYVKKQFASSTIIAPSFFFAKLSLLLLYLRVFAPNKHMRYLIYFGIGFGFCIYWLLLPVEAVYCAPHVGESWSSPDMSARCVKTIVMAVVQGPLNVVEDLYILLLPMHTIINLNLPRRKKIGVLVVFLTGLLAIIASVFGLYFRVLLYRARSSDATWYTFCVWITIILEIDFAIICASMPAFASFSKNVVGRSRLSRSQQSKTKDSTTRSHGMKPTSSRSESVSHLRDDNYIELDETAVANGYGRKGGAREQAMPANGEDGENGHGFQNSIGIEQNV